MDTLNPLGIHSAEFSTGQVVAAAGVAGPALQTWIKRSMIVGHGAAGVDMPGKPGHRRRFTFHNAMEIAVAAALIEAGTEVQRAFRVAGVFAHSGHADRRPPAFPFLAPGTETLLCVSGENHCIHKRRADQDDLSTIFSALGEVSGLTLIRVSPIFDRVAASLGYNPQELRHHFASSAPAK